MKININQTVTAAAYTSGMAVGGKIALPLLVDKTPATCAIVDAFVLDKAAQQQPYDLLFFNADLVGTVTDRQAFNLHDSDRSKLLGFISLTNQSTVGTGGIIVGSSLLYKRLSLIGFGAWAVLVTRGTPTFSAVNDVSLQITAEQVFV